MRCAFRDISCVVTSAIILPIGTHSDNLAAFYGCSLTPRTEKSTASTRGVCTVNSSRAEFRHRERKVANDIHDMPIPHERTENTIPHLFPSPDQPLLFSSFPLRPTSPLIASPFLFSLSRSRSTVSFASRVYLRSRKRNGKCTVWRLSHLQHHLNL